MPIRGIRVADDCPAACVFLTSFSISLLGDSFTNDLPGHRPYARSPVVSIRIERLTLSVAGLEFIDIVFKLLLATEHTCQIGIDELVVLLFVAVGIVGEVLFLI